MECVQTEYTWTHTKKSKNFKQEAGPFFFHACFDDNYTDCRYAFNYSITKEQKMTQLDENRKDVTELEMKW